MTAVLEARPGRVLGGVGDHGDRGRRDPVPGRVARVRAILAEIKRGGGIEHPPEWWRDRTVELVLDAIRRGAPADRCRELGRGFLARMARRFDAFERALWRWAYDHRRVPLDAHQQEVWRAVVFFTKDGRRIDLPGYIDAPLSPPLSMGEAPFGDLHGVAADLWALAYEAEERRAIIEEGQDG